jgi:hypothetical protein
MLELAKSACQRMYAKAVTKGPQYRIMDTEPTPGICIL